MILGIISHTEHYLTDEGRVVGLGSTIREINQLLTVFDEIYHVAPLHKKKAPQSSLPYKSSKIHFVPLKPVGGHKIRDKIKILTRSPENLITIHKTLKKVDCIQFRAPTSFGIYVLPYLSLIDKPKWVKYAGNWIQKNPVLSSAFQRWWLQNNLQKSLVTINGNWPDQKKHLLTFVNPCLTDEELEIASKVAIAKDFTKRLTLCFVGRIEREKGVDKLLEAVSKLANKEQLEKLILAGQITSHRFVDKLISENKDIAKKITFTGELSRQELDKVYEESHIFCLPSRSEGFPKSLIEAAAYGCVPVVSNVSSIGQYINESNGITLRSTAPEDIALALDSLLGNRQELSQKSQQLQVIVKKFTYASYNAQIIKRVIEPQI